MSKVETCLTRCEPAKLSWVCLSYALPNVAEAYLQLCREHVCTELDCESETLFIFRITYILSQALLKSSSRKTQSLDKSYTGFELQEHCHDNV